MDAEKIVKQLVNRDVDGRIAILANIALMDPSDRPGPTPKLAEILLETMRQVKQLIPSRFCCFGENVI
jgi:hypothetical protein